MCSQHCPCSRKTTLVPSQGPLDNQNVFLRNKEKNVLLSIVNIFQRGASSSSFTGQMSIGRVGRDMRRKNYWMPMILYLKAVFVMLSVSIAGDGYVQCY